MCDPWDSQGNENNAISIAFCLDFLIRNENITSEECKTKNRFSAFKKTTDISDIISNAKGPGTS